MRRTISNWGNFPKTEAEDSSFNGTEELWRRIDGHSGVIARGLGRCYGDAALARHVLSTLKMNHVLDFDRNMGVFECESGVSFEDILSLVVPNGWFLPVTPGTKYITVGGAVASDVHGKNHHVEGSFGRHVLDMDVMIGDGRVILCSADLEPDLFNATVGGMGLTGVITRVKFKLKRIETSYILQKTIKAANIGELVDQLEENRRYTYSVAWIDCLKGGAGMGRGIVMLGEHARIEELPVNLRSKPLALPRSKPLNLPFHLPSQVLNRFTVSVFNLLYYSRIRSMVQESIISYEPFFYPLDFITNWNRGYGRRGFLQYQFVIPLEARDVLKDILRRINLHGGTSFLSVLKTFGKDESLISFPMEGFTLALDFPVNARIFPFLDKLDEIVISNGGRIYLSKDARMGPDTFLKGYPNSQRFLEILKKYNHGRFSSLLSNRLRITT